MTPRARRRLEVLFPWLLIGILVAVWQISVVVFDVKPFVLPAPSDIVTAFIQSRGPIMQHALYTLTSTMTGFAMGVLFGVLLGVIIGSSRLIYVGVYPILIGFNSIPKVAIVPLLVLWLGIGQPTAIATAFLLSFFPIAVNIATGLATVEPELEDVLLSLGASKLDLLLKVGLPRALPYFFASLKVSITLAFIGAVIAETIASNDGIGYLMLQASSQFRVPLMFAGVLVIAVMGIVTYLIFAFIERRMTGWATRGRDLQVSQGG
jgi:NitT/TauT family transport system permease protein